MTFRVRFEREAEAELNQAIAWYDLQAAGVGQKFSHAVHAALNQAAHNPRRYLLVGPTTRKVKILHWPYSIYFTLSEGPPQLIVVSVFHGSRDPAKLRRRLK